MILVMILVMARFICYDYPVIHMPVCLGLTVYRFFFFFPINRILSLSELPEQ